MEFEICPPRLFLKKLVLVLSVLYSQFLFSIQASNQSNNLTLIQGHPCNDSNGIITTTAKYARECDQICSETESCESFTWSRLNSTCKLYSTYLVKDCYVINDQTFWFVKNYPTNREEFDVSVTLTKGNRYGNPRSSEPLVKSCLALSGGEYNFDRADEHCKKETGYEVYSPKNLNELRGMVECSGILEDFWTGFRYVAQVGSSNQGVSFASENLMTFEDDPMIVQDVNWRDYIQNNKGISFPFFREPN